jgi:hypothetical protein
MNAGVVLKAVIDIVGDHPCPICTAAIQKPRVKIPYRLGGPVAVGMHPVPCDGKEPDIEAQQAKEGRP